MSEFITCPVCEGKGVVPIEEEEEAKTKADLAALQANIKRLEGKRRKRMLEGK